MADRPPSPALPKHASALSFTCIAVVVRVLYEQGMNAYVQARWCSMCKALVAAQGNGTAPCIGQLVGWRIARKHVKHCLLFNMWCAEDDRLSSCCGPCLCTGRPFVYAHGNCPARMANTNVCGRGRSGKLLFCCRLSVVVVCSPSSS